MQGARRCGCAGGMEEDVGTALILRHARMALESRHYGDELHTMRHMRSRILAYTKGFPGAKEMRSRLVRVSSMPELEDLLSKLPRQKP